MKFVLDSSVIAKLFFDEAGAEEATEFVELCVEETIELAASELVLYEVGNVIWKNLRKKGMDGRKYIRQLRLLNIDYISLDEELMLDAMETSQENDITYYDGAHVTLAQTRKAPLVTEDRKLLEGFASTMSIETALGMVKRT